MKELRLKLPQFHIFPLCLCYLFLPFVSLPTTHTLTPERGWARERAREHAQACEGIDRWSIIRHEQPRKVGQRKDGAYGICLNSEDIQWLEKMNEWDLGLLFVWVLLPVLCVTVPAGVWWWALPWNLSDPSCLFSGIETHYITERPGSMSVRPQTLHLVLLRPQFPHLWMRTMTGPSSSRAQLPGFQEYF